MKRWSIRGAPSPEQIGEIAAMLTNGGVVLMPTDTIYGLHAIAGSDAVKRIVAIKERDESKRFVTIASSIEQARTCGDVPDVLEQIWPAPLTAIVRVAPAASGRPATAATQRTIAIRVPDLDWLRALLDKTGPLVSTSANRSGEPPIEAPNDLALDLQNALDGIVDAGPIAGKPSAIVDFTGEQPSLVREGDARFTQFLRKTLRKTL